MIMLPTSYNCHYHTVIDITVSPILQSPLNLLINYESLSLTDHFLYSGVNFRIPFLKSRSRVTLFEMKSTLNPKLK